MTGAERRARLASWKGASLPRRTSPTRCGRCGVPTASAAWRSRSKIRLSPGLSNIGIVGPFRDVGNHLFCKVERTKPHPEGFLAIGRRLHGHKPAILVHENQIGLEAGERYILKATRKRVEDDVLDQPERNPPRHPHVHDATGRPCSVRLGAQGGDPDAPGRPGHAARRGRWTLEVRAVRGEDDVLGVDCDWRRC